MGYYSALERTEILTPATTRVSHEDRMLNGISQLQKDKYYLSSLLRGTYSGQIHRDKKWMVGPRRWGVSIEWMQSFSLGGWKSSGDGVDGCTVQLTLDPHGGLGRQPSAQ